MKNHQKSRYPYVNAKYRNIFVNVGIPSWVKVSKVPAAGFKEKLSEFPCVRREIFTVSNFRYTNFPLYAWLEV